MERRFFLPFASALLLVPIAPAMAYDGASANSLAKPKTYTFRSPLDSMGRIGSRGRPISSLGTHGGSGFTTYSGSVGWEDRHHGSLNAAYRPGRKAGGSWGYSGGFGRRVRRRTARISNDNNHHLRPLQQQRLPVVAAATGTLRERRPSGLERPGKRRVKHNRRHHRGARRYQ
ncbi:MAG: hypothetical protein IT371_01155 [Deltaproteobacteria bacterium]|nr:hypothetical protein [Deltaproteobacteria bacterium]